MHTSELNYVFIDNTFGAKAADLYRRRRQQVIQSSPHPIIMTGIHSETHPDHSFSHFRPFIVQDPAMLYLTGINQANALLVITTEKQLIFLPKKNKKTEFWDGKKLAYSDDVDNAALSQLLGCDSILPISSFKTVIKELFSDKKVIQKGGKITKAYDINPHNVGHLIAHQVHDGDVYRNYKSIPLKAGNIITNEPGFYGHVQMKINGHLYSDDIGIRIEDDLLITEEGCENLSKAIPKSIAQIEKLLQSSVKS